MGAGEYPGSLLIRVDRESPVAVQSRFSVAVRSASGAGAACAAPVAPRH